MNKDCVEKKMRNGRGVQKPQGKNINELDALRSCMSREMSWMLTVKEDGFSVMVDVNASLPTRSVQMYRTSSGDELPMAPCLRDAVLEQFVKINFTGTVYCEFASTFSSNDIQRGFDKANTFSSRTANPIRLDEFRAKGCRLVALYTDDMEPGIASASKRLRPLKKLPRITTDVSTGIVTWPNEVVVCVEILAEKVTPDEAIAEIRKWLLVSTKAGATRREGVVLIPDEGKLVTFGTVDKTYANYRKESWFKVKEQHLAKNVVVKGFNKKTNSALVDVINTENYSAGSWKMWSVPLNYVDKSSIVNMLAKAAFDNDDTSDDDDDAVRPVYLAMGCAIRWYVGHVAVRFFVIFNVKKIAGKAQIPLFISQTLWPAGKRLSPPPPEIEDAGSADKEVLAEARESKRPASSAAEGPCKRFALPPAEIEDAGSADKVVLAEARESKRPASSAAEGPCKRFAPPPPEIQDAGSADKVLVLSARADNPLPMKNSTSVAQVDVDMDEVVIVKGICPVCKQTVYGNCCRVIRNGAYHHAHCGHSPKTFFLDRECACGACPVRQPNVHEGVIVID